jgi:YD repeat-containing protein
MDEEAGGNDQACAGDGCDCGQEKVPASQVQIGADCRMLYQGVHCLGGEHQRLVWPEPAAIDAGSCLLESIAAELRRYGSVGPAWMNPGNGDLMLPIRPPEGGLFQAVPGIAYNSLSPEASPFGYGVHSDFTSEVREVDSSTAEVLKGSGTVLCYTRRDAATGFYDSPRGVSNTLQRTGNGWIERLPNHYELHYDAGGRLVKLVSVSQDTWTLSFDEGRLASVEDPFGQRTTFSYDANGQLGRITDAADRESHFTVDAAGNLTQYATPELCLHGLEYDEQGRLAAYVDPEGNRSRYTYDDAGRLVGYENALGERTTYRYLPGGLTEIENPLGAVATLTFCPAGQLLSAVDPLGRTTAYTWEKGRVRSVQGPSGQITTVSYEDAGQGRLRTTEVVSPGGSRAAYGYDQQGRLASKTDPGGQTTTLVWNAAGQRIATVHAAGSRTTYTYDAHNRVTAVQSPLGRSRPTCTGRQTWWRGSIRWVSGRATCTTGRGSGSAR